MNLHNEPFLIREAKSKEFEETGKMMVGVYSGLKGFPQPEDFPQYYDLLLHIGRLTEKPKTSLLIASDNNKAVLGAVVYLGDMSNYGSKGLATQEKNAAGIRFLAVSPNARGLGIGKALTFACIQKAKDSGLAQVILHTTLTMMTAWKMYEKMGFQRAYELDFDQGDLHVFGFRLLL
ncbi:GNAT family N-acetyltransferase [Algoriphagus boritolerans]|uniref:Acetyltransferase (GNAT) family protein n=1 Tax=Algoriphagus boritolerans DSM 17298 = JCM 18970 TaxID=1120964 RepID=A0A1H5X5Q6_9BACT|nr:GNAT family N-acetyltransferase [Algoriphagus boritolerans]SEG06710.1 Acetyltransferase (GNAT) family protein [Algoriphagus boritolerans DSM 17298 = JCM 18970]